MDIIDSLPHTHKYNTRYKKKNDYDYNIEPLEFQLFLTKIFPSKYMKNKSKLLLSLNNSKIKKNIIKNKHSNITTKQKQKQKQTQNTPDDCSESDEDYEDEDYEDEDYEDDDEDEDEDDDDEYECDEDEDEDDECDDDEDDECDNDEDDECDERENEDNDFIVKRKFLNNLVSIANERKKSLSVLNKNKGSKEKEFKELINLEDNLNDIKYFTKELDDLQKNNIIEELKKVNSKFKIYKPYRILILEMNIPTEFKIVALKKIGMLETMNPSASEYFKLKLWMDSFMSLPFNKIHTLPISSNDGFTKCSDYIKTSIDILDKAVFGLNDAKMQIMQLLAQWITNPDALGNALAIKGPMGTGKTTLIKEGISKLLNRPFSLIALGGATDASVLEGHSYTYEGSTYGKIVDILIQTQCSNPIIYFDELDKVSDSAKGDEIIGILTHLIDSSQNTNFHDKYFSEIDFDLSKALFIFSYNDETKINPILRDRMYKITTKGYDKKEKNIIAKKYLLSSICKQVKFDEENIIINDDTIDYIIDNYTENESGVRNLKRCLEIIFTKLNLFRLMPKGYSLFNVEDCFTVEFPFNVTIPIVQKLIKKEQSNDSWKVMYM
jgi:ATP-dependent Lon protease